MDINRARNLLFGVLAVQLRGVNPAQLAEVSAEWAADASVPVARRLVDKGYLAGEDAALLEKFVDDAICVYDSNPDRVLGLFGGEEHLEKVFCAGLDSQNLDNIDTAPMEGGSHFTGRSGENSGVSETPGRYTLISRHAKGGMGRVLIVQDEYLGRNIALKELMPTGPSGGGDKATPIRQSAALIARFLQEARITSQLEHPAIVPVYELGRRQDGTLYYTMRLVRGKTFAAALSECAGLDERLGLLPNFVSLCQAIAYAHSRNVIHRDIKPANVMLGQFGETVVLDWGLAKLRDAEDIHVEDIREALQSLELGGGSPQPLTAYGRALGTPHYMPPEQAAGKIEAIDERSDVYSLGAVLYEILTGTTPYSGKNTREIIEKVLHQTPVPVLETVPDAPPELAVICQKALNKTAADRYQSAAELAAEVERFIQGSLVRAYRYSPRQILAHYYAKHRPLINTALACVVLLLVMGVASYLSILQARDREHDQRLVAEAARRDENVARTVAERKTYLSQVHLAQAHVRERDFGRATDLLWETAEKERGWEWGYLLNRANPDVYTIETPNSNLSGAVFSPDGSRIGTITDPEPPSIYDALSGKKLVTLEDGTEIYTQTAFSPDGSKYMGISWEGAVTVWDAASGKRLQHFSLNAQGYCAVFDATGNYLFAGAGDGKVHVFDLQRGEPAYELNMETGPIDHMVMNSRKDRLLTATQEGTGQLWDPAARTRLLKLTGAMPVFSPDGSRIAAIQGTEVAVWNAETGAEVARLKGHAQGISGLRYNSDGSRMLSASQDGTVLLWDLASARILQTYTLSVKVAAVDAFFLSGESFVLACSADNQFVLFDAQTGSVISRIPVRGKVLNLANLQPGGSLLAITTDNHVLQALNPLAPTGTESVVAELGAKDCLSYGLSSSASGKLVAFLRDRSRERIWLADTNGKKGLCSFSASFGCKPNMPTLSDDGSRLAMVVDAHVAAVIVDPASANPTMAAFTGHTAPVASIALRADGRGAASGDDNGEICLWNTEDARTEKRWKAHEDTVTRMQFSRDGERLLSCGLDGQTVLWTCDTGEKLRAFDRQDKGIATAAFSEDETRVLTIDVDGTAQIWDAIHGKSMGRVSVGPQVGTKQNWWMLVEAQFWPGGKQFLTQYPETGSTLWDAETMSPLLFFRPAERVIPMRGGQSLAVADQFGNLRTVRMPGTLGTSPTRAEFQQYQLEWASRTAFDLPKDACPTRMFISGEDLARGIDGLIQMEAAQPQPGQTIPRIETATRTQAMAAMGLEAGDGILAINDTPLANAAAAKTALESAAGRLAQNPQAGLALTALRNGQERIYSYWTLPLTREEAAVTLTHDEALGLVQHEIDRTSLQIEMHATSAWLPLVFPSEEAAAAKARLENGVVLAAVDGIPCDSVAALRQTLMELRQRIASGETLKFSQAFRLGVCRELARTFTVGSA